MPFGRRLLEPVGVHGDDVHGAASFRSSSVACAAAMFAHIATQVCFRVNVVPDLQAAQDAKDEAVVEKQPWASGNQTHLLNSHKAAKS